MSLRLAPSGSTRTAQARESASLRRRLRAAHGEAPASPELSGSFARKEVRVVDAQAQYAERIRRRLEAALEPPSPTSPRSPSAWSSPGGSIGSERSLASSTASASTRPAWDDSPKTDGWRAASARSPVSGQMARAYSPTRETWFGAPNKDLSWAACEKEARQLAQAGAEARAAQQKRVEQMTVVANSPVPAMALARSAGYSTSEWDGTTRRQRRRPSVTGSTFPASHTDDHTSRSGYNRSPSPRKIPSKSLRRRVNMDAVPAGWETATSQTTGNVYYVNMLTGESTYQTPTAPAAAARRSRAGGRSGEEWASDVLSQLDSSSSPAPTGVKSEVVARAANEAARKGRESKLQKQMNSAVDRELAAQEAARQKSDTKQAKKREEEQTKLRVAERKAAEKAARQRMLAEKKAAQKQAAAKRQEAQERAASDKRTALDQAKALRAAAYAKKRVPEAREPSSASSLGKGRDGDAEVLPEGWEEHRSKSTGEIYWLSTVTWEPVFVQPTAPAIDAKTPTETQSQPTDGPNEISISAEADVDLQAQPHTNVHQEAASKLTPKPGMVTAAQPEHLPQAQSETVLEPETKPEPKRELKQEFKRQTKDGKAKDLAKRQAVAEKKATEELQKALTVEEESQLIEPEPEPEPEPEQEPKRKKKNRKAKEAAQKQAAAEKRAAEELQKVLAAEEEAAMLEQADNSFSSTLSLPTGWEEARSRSSGEVYYRNLVTGESTYEFPKYPADIPTSVTDRTDNPDTDVGLASSTTPDSSAGTEVTGAVNDRSEHSATLDSVSERMGIAPSTSSAASDVSAVLAPSSTTLQSELQQLKLQELRARAADLGVDAAAIDVARDAHDPEQELIVLIVDAEASRLSAPTDESQAAEPQQVLSIDLNSLRDELTIYHASGQKKHPRFFWLTPQSDGQTQNDHLLHWGKKLDARQAKFEKLIRVIDKPTIPDAERLFYDMDEDDSGYLDDKEVATLYKKARGEKLSKSNLGKAMREMDSNGNNQVSIDEFRAWWLKHGGDLEQHRDRAFTFVCQSGAEVLVVAKDMETKNRWVGSCAQLLPTAASDNLAPSGLLTLYHMTGQKKHSRFFWMNAESKHISWGKSLRSKTCKTEPLLRVIGAPGIPDARELFHQTDTDNSGYLDSMEVAALYKKARGERLAGKKLKEAMKVMDSDGNDQVSLTEFEEWWANNGGDFEQHRTRAMTFVCGSGIELLVVAPDMSTKRRWLKGCKKLGLLECVNEAAPQDAVPQHGSHVDTMRLQQLENTLPVGWETATSQKTGDSYYINTLTGDSTYDMPTAPADTLQTEFQVMTPAVPAPAQTPEVVQQPTANSQDSQKKAADFDKQAEKELKKLKKEEAKRAKKTAKDQAREQKANKKKGGAEPPPPDLTALANDLPAGWEPAESRSTGDIYYVNTVSGESTYDRPSEPAFTDSFLSTAGSEEVGAFRPLPMPHTRC
eukprot:COSAG02_NODE_285_length_25646_cov_10.858143_2_plen_1450_part_00